jgi:hypothetical protein
METFLLLIGTAANVVMAGAAVAAYKLWHRQVKAPSEHELARRLAKALHAVTEVRDVVLDALVEGAKPATVANHVLGGILSLKTLEDGEPNLKAAVEAVRALEHDVEITWGEQKVLTLYLIRRNSEGLAGHIAAKRAKSFGAQLAFMNSETGYSFYRNAYRYQTGSLTDLLLDFLAGLIRDRASRMSDAEYAAKFEAILRESEKLHGDDEAARKQDELDHMDEIADAEAEGYEAWEKEKAIDAAYENPRLITLGAEPVAQLAATTEGEGGSVPVEKDRKPEGS